MRFQITHTTRYLYDRSVFLEPHTLRLRPRCDPFQQLQHFMLTIRPQPAGLTESVDLDGNASAVAWFQGLTQELRVTSRCTVDTICTNPFDFIVSEPVLLNLPAKYSPNLAGRLVSYLTMDPGAESIEPFVRGVYLETHGRTLDFLPVLCERIHEKCRGSIRHEGLPYPPAETLEREEGACRDLAVLFMEACRRVGLAARFVSGYQEAKPVPGPRHLHAWAEVYLPGGGWRGYDPSSGLAVADHYVALAASAVPEGAGAVIGTIRGTDACSSMYADVQLEVIDLESEEQLSAVFDEGQQLGEP